MMAHRILRAYPRSIINRNVEIKQRFKYLLVLDFEATCEQFKKLDPQEIIEFPCVALSTKEWKVENTFHEYIKPKVHPKLTPFCTDLTGIIQDMVEDRPYFPDVFRNFCTWLEKHKYLESENASAFVTCGEWDLGIMLPNQCALSGVALPDHFKRWINLKQSFNEATNHYPTSMKQMALRLRLPLEGHLHSGIDDVMNMINIIRVLKDKNKLEFKITASYDSAKRTVNGVIE